MCPVTGCSAKNFLFLSVLFQYAWLLHYLFEFIRYFKSVLEIKWTMLCEMEA